MSARVRWTTVRRTALASSLAALVAACGVSGKPDDAPPPSPPASGGTGAPDGGASGSDGGATGGTATTPPATGGGGSATPGDGSSGGPTAQGAGGGASGGTSSGGASSGGGTSSGGSGNPAPPPGPCDGLFPTLSQPVVSKGRSTLHVLVDGTVVLSGPSQEWVKAVPDGGGAADVPAWLAARPRTRLATIRAGRAYAVLPIFGADQLEIVTASGESCGTVKVPVPTVTGGQARLDVGQDGTLLLTSSTSPDATPRRCEFRWWPALLR